MKTEEQIMSEVKDVNGARRTRTASRDDIDLLLSTIADNPDAKTVRVYPKNAFVARSYFGRAVCTVLHATRGEAGWEVEVREMDAHRPHGQGPRVTCNGR